KRIEFLETQNFLGIEGVGVSPQRLDLGDAETFWAQLDRRPRHRSFAWRRDRARLVDCPCKAQIIISAFPARLPRGIAQRCHALKEPRSHHRRAIAFAGAAQNHFAFAHGLREIMGRLAEFALWRRQAQSGAHGPVEKSIGACLRWPSSLIKAAKQYDSD